MARGEQIDPQLQRDLATRFHEASREVFGAAAGIAEMLLQSHDGVIRLLPALPDAWVSGSIKGLKARGGFEVNIAWEKGKLTHAAIRSLLGEPCTVRYGTKSITFKTSRGKSYRLDQRMTLPR